MHMLFAGRSGVIGYTIPRKIHDGKKILLINSIKNYFIAADTAAGNKQLDPRMI